MNHDTLAAFLAGLAVPFFKSNQALALLLLTVSDKIKNQVRCDNELELALTATDFETTCSDPYVDRARNAFLTTVRRNYIVLFTYKNN